MGRITLDTFSIILPYHCINFCYITIIFTKIEPIQFVCNSLSYAAIHAFVYEHKLKYTSIDQPE